MRIKKTSQYIEGGAGLPSYFTTETDTGMKWIDGKTIYRKVIDFGALPNATEKVVQHGINNLDTIVNVSCISKNTSNGVYFIIPLASTAGLSSCIYILATTQNITIGAGSDRTSFNKTYVTLEYTKN